MKEIFENLIREPWLWKSLNKDLKIIESEVYVVRFPILLGVSLNSLVDDIEPHQD